MKVRTDIEVAVLSARTDLDLAISTWLSGYTAQRTDDPDVVMDVARRGGVVLIDLGSPRHEEWVAALGERGLDAPTVFLDPRGDVTIDLRDGVVVSSPPSLSGLLAGFEEAQLTRRGSRRRNGTDAGQRTHGTGRRRTSTTPATTSPVGRPGASAPAVEDVPRARRLDHHHEPEAAAVPVARRSGRRRATRATSVWGALRRRFGAASQSSDAKVDTPGGGRPAVTDAEVDTPGGGRPAAIDAEAERAFQAAFREAESQPGVQRRIATHEGRIRVQTDEELFAGQPDSTPAADELGTVLTPVPARERRARAGA